MNNQTATKQRSFETSAEVLKVISHPLRLHILDFLSRAGIGQQSVTNVIREVEQPQAIVSQHLILLKDRGVLKSVKQGTQVLYSVVEPKLIGVVQAIEKLAV